MKVCIYARVGNNDQAALDAQVEMLKDYASAKGYAVTAVVSVSGTSGLQNGQSIKSIIEMADKDIFDAVLAVKPSRFSRDTVTYMDFAGKLKEQGKTICYALPDHEAADSFAVFDLIHSLEQLAT